MKSFDGPAQSAAEYYKKTGTDFFKNHFISKVRNMKAVAEKYELVKTKLPKTHAVEILGLLDDALEAAIERQLAQKDSGGVYRVFESYPDPHQRGHGRLYHTVVGMTRAQCVGVRKQVIVQKRDFVSKEKAWDILIDLLTKVGKDAVVSEEYLNQATTIVRNLKAKRKAA